jgi:predicted site-specific integrase-resolvase
MRIGSARVSTTEQNLDLKRDALRRAGCDTIIEDTDSGGKMHRTGLERVWSGIRHLGTNRRITFKERDDPAQGGFIQLDQLDRSALYQAAKRLDASRFIAQEPRGFGQHRPTG